MRIAIPVMNGQLSLHFGHCDEFAIADVDEANKQTLKVKTYRAPSHEPGALPQWLREENVDVIIAGGMGRRAQMLLEQYGIRVVVGAETAIPEELVDEFLQGTLATGANICDH